MENFYFLLENWKDGVKLNYFLLKTISDVSSVEKLIICNSWKQITIIKTPLSAETKWDEWTCGFFLVESIIVQVHD